MNANASFLSALKRAVAAGAALAALLLTAAPVAAQSSVVELGSSCGPTQLVAAERVPAAGGDLLLSLSGEAGAPFGVLLIGPAESSLRLDALGMAGCRLLVNTAVPTVSMTFPLDAHPLAVEIPLDFAGRLVVQAFHAEPGLNALGVAATNGLRVEIAAAANESASR